MAIRKDIDDMLNSLKSGTPSQPEKPVSELPKLRRKTKFDNMSVDDLLTAISEPDPVQPQSAPAAPPVVDEPVNISVPDPDPERVFQFVQDDEQEFPQKAPEEHHNIVINEELPDYEAIRQAQLEMDRLERERAAAAASFNAAREHEHTASVDELQQFSARIAAENTAGKVAEDAAAALEQLSEFSAPKKKGFFSHFINRDDWKTPYTEPDPVPAQQPEYPQQPQYNAAPEPQQPQYSAAPEVPQQPQYNAASEPQQPQYNAAPVQKSLTETALIEGIPVVGEGMDSSAFAEPVKESLPEVEQTVADEQSATFSEPEYIPEPEEFAANAAVSDFTETSAAAADDNATTFYEDTVAGDMPDDNEPQLDEYNNPSVDELMAAAIAAVNEEIAAEKEHESAEEEAGHAVDSMIAGIREDAANAIADMDMAPSQIDEAPFSAAQPVPEPVPQTAAPEPEPVPDKPKGKVTSTLENILSEDPDDIINARSEKTEFDGFINKDSSRVKKILYTVLGVIFAALACVGLVTVIGKGIGFASRFASGESQKEKFAKAVYPAVIMDISDFQQPSELTSDQVITAAIWSMVMTDGALDKYERNFDVVTIPAVDVEAAAVKLFGDGLTELTHTNVGTGDAKFYYSEEKKSYNIQVHPIVYSYAPDIKSVTKNGNEYTVNVDYINELPSWLERTSTKSVVFTLVETSDGYQIRSMKVTSAKLSL